MVGGEGAGVGSMGVGALDSSPHVCPWSTEKEDGAISTIVLRGSTDNLMDDVERAVDDAVNTFKVLTRVSTGASEVALAAGLRRSAHSSALGGLPWAAGGKQSPVPEVRELFLKGWRGGFHHRHSS